MIEMRGRFVGSEGIGEGGGIARRRGAACFVETVSSFHASRRASCQFFVGGSLVASEALRTRTTSLPSSSPSQISLPKLRGSTVPPGSSVRTERSSTTSIPRRRGVGRRRERCALTAARKGEEREMAVAVG